MKRWKNIAVAAAILAVAISVQAMAAGQWLHVRVEERGNEETVKVNVPLALAESLLPMVEEHGRLGRHGIRIGRHRHHWTVQDLRDAWQKAKAEGNFEFLSIEKGNESVRAAIEGENLVVRGTEGDDEEFNVQVPIQVVDALLSGSGEELDFRAALESLSNLGSQTLVSVKDRDSVVRVWIDESSGQ